MNSTVFGRVKLPLKYVLYIRVQMLIISSSKCNKEKHRDEGEWRNIGKEGPSGTELEIN